jgi:glycosyltransferase involved in cell wall biosynthesis
VPSNGLHILVLVDRDWHHPQAGGTGTNLWWQVSHWLEWGHRVTVVACAHENGGRIERHGGLTVHRIGTRMTLFPRAIAAVSRGLVPDADVVLEVINGITFLTPLWLRGPRVAFVHHIHRGHYVEELGWPGLPAALALETAPLAALYRRTPFLTVSHASAAEIAAHGIPVEQIEVNYNGIDVDGHRPGRRAERPRLLYLGRLKRYKRLEILLDALLELPGVELDVAGDGDQRPQVEAAIAARGLADRVHLHGFVSDAHKVELLQAAWVHVTASAAEGWSLSVMEAAACETPSVAFAVGGLRESIQHGHTGLLADDAPTLTAHLKLLLGDDELRQRMGEAGRARATELSWERAARQTLQRLARSVRESGSPVDVDLGAELAPHTASELVH